MFCRHFVFATDWENWGENDRLPQFSFLPPTLGKLFTSPQLSTVFLFQDGGLNIRWKYISTRPVKIRLHCRLKTHINHSLRLHFMKCYPELAVKLNMSMLWRVFSLILVFVILFIAMNIYIKVHPKLMLTRRLGAYTWMHYSGCSDRVK